MKKFCIGILVAALMFCVCIFGAAAADELTFDRAVALDDTTIILEFSEPIAVNKNGNTAGPYCAIRFVTGDNTDLYWDGDTPLQIDGTLTGAGEGAPDKLIWTMNTANAFEASSISDILSYNGNFAKYEGIKIMFCIEEIPKDVDALKTDRVVENISNLDGSVCLKATTVAASDSVWEGAYVEIESDPDYQIYESAASESTSNESSSAVSSETIGLGDDALSQPQDGDSQAETAPVESGVPTVYIVVICVMAAAIVALAAALVCALAKRKKQG